MLYGGKPQKPVPPSKIGCRRNVEFRGLEPYTYAIVSIICYLFI